jgi:hypothetical protein
MPARSRFSAQRTAQVPSSRTYPGEVIHDFRGLDLTSPYDLIEKGRTPYAKNFRLYAEDSDSRRIGVSTRKGQGEYISPIGETINVVNTSTTGAANQAIGVVLNNRAMPFTPSSTGRLTDLELNIRKGTGVGPVTVSIHEDTSGAPGRMLAESTILGSAIGTSYAYVPAYFIEAPLVTNGTQYWFFVHTQDDGADGYEVSSNTASTLSLISNAGIPGLAATTYSLNFKTYLSPDYKDKGATRFAQPFGINRTIVAYNTSVYLIDDVAGTATSIKEGLNALATNYRFSFGDGKVFWVNGYDDLMAWNGTTISTNPDVMTNGTFEVNTTGWAATGGGTGNAITRNTGEFHTGVASMKIAASSGTRSAQYAMVLAKGVEYKISYWAKGASGTTRVTFPVATQTSTNVTMTGAWTLVEATIAPQTADTAFRIQSTADIYIDDVTVHATGIEIITDAELPILSLFTFHKDRAWGVSAADPNKIVFSENPGNPSDAPSANQQWYYAWLSVSFVYVPAPKATDAITGIVSFQDVLKIFTYTNKYDLYGSDRASLALRQSTGSKGAVAQESILADETFIYFAAQDGFYRHNGSSDELISDLVQSEFDGIAFPGNITVAKWKRQIRFYYGANASPTNTDCLLYHTVFEEWQHDTDVHVNRAVYFADGDDDRRLVEFSSLVPAIYNAEQGYNAMGKAIDFAYWLKYDSFGGPAQKKRILKYFPLFQGVDRSFVINVDMDKDFSNSPLLNRVILASLGAVWGEFEWGDGTLWGGSSTFQPAKLRYPGYAYYWQLRISRKGADNPVFFFGVQYNYKPKRL